MSKMIAVNDDVYDRLRVIRDQENISFNGVIDDLLILHGMPEKTGFKFEDFHEVEMPLHSDK